MNTLIVQITCKFCTLSTSSDIFIHKLDSIMAPIHICNYKQLICNTGYSIVPSNDAVLLEVSNTNLSSGTLESDENPFLIQPSSLHDLIECLTSHPVDGTPITTEFLRILFNNHYHSYIAESSQVQVRCVEAFLTRLELEHTPASEELFLGLLRFIPVTLKWGQDKWGTTCRDLRPLDLFVDNPQKQCVFDAMYVWSRHINLDHSCVTPLVLSELLVRIIDPHGKFIPTLLRTFEHFKETQEVLLVVAMLSPNHERAFQVVTHILRPTECIDRICLCFTGIIIRFSNVDQFIDLFDKFRARLNGHAALPSTSSFVLVEFALNFYNTILFICQTFTKNNPFLDDTLFAFLRVALAARVGIPPETFLLSAVTVIYDDIFKEVRDLKHSVFQPHICFRSG